MLISNYVDGVTGDLKALAELGGDALSTAATRLSVALDAPLRARFLEALNQLIAEQNAFGTSGALELRLAGDDVTIVARDVEVAATSLPKDLNARVALRLPDDAKEKIEDVATTEGVSVNAWIVRNLQSALERSATSVATRSGRHLRGTGLS